MTHPEAPWLEAAFARARASIEYPPTPDIAPAVMVAIGGATPSPAGLRLRYAVIALVAMLAGALVMALSIGSSRDAIAEFLGLAVEGERIEVIPAPPGGQPLALPSPAALEDFASRTSLAEAATDLGFEPAMPAGLEPQAAYMLQYEIGSGEYAFHKPMLVLRFEGFDLWQSTTDGLVGKGITLDGTTVETTRVGEDAAYWIEGGPRLVTMYGPNGTEIAGSQRTATENTLVWATRGRYYRIEGDLTLEEALAIAVTVTE